MKIKPYLHIHGIASTKTSNNVPWSNGLKTNQINWVTRLQKKEVIKLHLVEMLSLSKRTVAYITNYGNIFLQRSVVEFKPYAWVWEVKSGNANRQRVSLQKRVLMNCIYMVTFKWKRLSIIQEAGNEAVVSHPRLEADGRYQLQKLEKKKVLQEFWPLRKI